MIGLAVALYVTEGCGAKPGDLKPLARGDMAKLEVEAAGPPAPSGSFLDVQGQPTNLGRLKARVVVVNLWATWCGPCVTEMPTLAKLQAEFPGQVLVVPVSMDTAKDREKARAFIGQYPPLGFYQDPKADLVWTFTPPVQGLPTTILYDPAGRERARLTGGADWSGADAKAVIAALLEGESG
jgi:thiol-disulfide isomerase/thioredoxin